MRKIKILKFIVIIFLVVVVSVVIYAIYNLNYDYSGEKFRKNKASSLGLEEKQFNLKNGNVINYVEGPKNGPAILLLHGQMVDWKDYRTVFPELVKNIMSLHLIIMDMESQVKILIYIILKA